jgi:hypothetical protein
MSDVTKERPWNSSQRCRSVGRQIREVLRPCWLFLKRDLFGPPLTRTYSRMLSLDKAWIRLELFLLGSA